MTVIEKKCWPEYFGQILKGEKKFEFRLADFEISEGDTLLLKEFDPETKAYTGRELAKKAGKIIRIKNILGMYSAEQLKEFGAMIIELE